MRAFYTVGDRCVDVGVPGVCIPSDGRVLYGERANQERDPQCRSRQTSA